MEAKIEIKGFYLDNQNMVSPGINASGKVEWYLITFLKEVIDGKIQIGEYGEKLFDMQKIDPDDFEWNGQRLSIDFGDTDAKKRE